MTELEYDVAKDEVYDRAASRLTAIIWSAGASSIGAVLVSDTRSLLITLYVAALLAAAVLAIALRRVRTLAQLRAAAGLAEDEVDVDLEELGRQPVTLESSAVIAALREAWREGEALAAYGDQHVELAQVGFGMKDAAEKIAASLGVDEAELRAEGAPADDA
ncbi:hypothetical protein [Sorangium sp. So ce693]|uniref:hypothetical protein n=1 Tax=Sorangium sp. So ce693 TaxID=3133318 RepID=UPI003F5ED0E4